MPFTGSVFKEIDDFYSSNYYLLRGSGKIKTELKLAADVLEIQHYSLPKMTGTRFIGHRRRALTTLLNMWPAFDMAYENIKADPKTRNETKAKVTGLLKKFKNYRFLVLSCVYLDLLEQTTPVSKIFESNSLLPFEVKPLVKTAIFNLSDQIEDSDMLDSHLQRFKRNNDDKTVIKSQYDKKGDKSRNAQNRQQVTITFKDLTFLNDETLDGVQHAKIKAAQELIETLTARFESFDNEEVFNCMNWFNPQNWSDEKDYGLDEILEFSNQFNEPLAEAGYDHSKITQEWKKMRRYVEINLPKKEPAQLWRNIINHNEREYPNISLLAKLMLSGFELTV